MLDAMEEQVDAFPEYFINRQDAINSVANDHQYDGQHMKPSTSYAPLACAICPNTLYSTVNIQNNIPNPV